MSDFDRPWARGLRGLMLKKLCEQGPMTSREMATACEVSEKAIAPRWTELETMGLVHDTGNRRHSISGKGRTSKVWEATQ
jgi:predicted ArsR family transcriptional regulator